MLGSAIIAFGLIPALVFLFGKHETTTLHTWPILRETAFYLIGLYLFLKSLFDGKMTSYECAGLICVYLTYVSIVVFIFWYFPTSTTVNYSEIKTDDCGKDDREDGVDNNNNDNNDNDDNDDDAVHVSYKDDKDLKDDDKDLGDIQHIKNDDDLTGDDKDDNLGETEEFLTLIEDKEEVAIESEETESEEKEDKIASI